MVGNLKRKLFLARNCRVLPQKIYAPRILKNIMVCAAGAERSAGSPGRALKLESYTRAGRAAGMGKLGSAWAGDLVTRGRALRPGNQFTA